MIFNIGHFSKYRVNVENKMRGLEITPLNFKIYQHETASTISDLLVYETPLYFNWETKTELKARFKKDLEQKIKEVEKLQMLIKICSRKHVFLAEKD